MPSRAFWPASSQGWWPGAVYSTRTAATCSIVIRCGGSAALGHLAGQPSIATVQLLREYVAWERRPLLRSRGVRLLRDVEQALA